MGLCVQLGGEKVGPQGLKPRPIWLVLIGTAKSRALPDCFSVKTGKGTSSTRADCGIPNDGGFSHWGPRV